MEKHERVESIEFDELKVILNLMIHLIFCNINPDLIGFNIMPSQESRWVGVLLQM